MRWNNICGTIFGKGWFPYKYIFFIDILIKFWSLFAFPIDAGPFKKRLSSFYTISIERPVFSNCLLVCLLFALIDVCFCIFFCLRSSSWFFVVFAAAVFLFRVGCSSSCSLESSSRIFLHENSKLNGLLYQVHLSFGKNFSRQFFGSL